MAPGHISTLYTAMGVMQASGALVAGPVLVVTFKAGLGWGEAWEGLPFLVVAVSFALGVVDLGAVRLKGDSIEGEDVEDAAGPLLS